MDNEKQVLEGQKQAPPEVTLDSLAADLARAWDYLTQQHIALGMLADAIKLHQQSLDLLLAKETAKLPPEPVMRVN